MAKNTNKIKVTIERIHSKVELPKFFVLIKKTAIIRIGIWITEQVRVKRPQAINKPHNKLRNATTNERNSV